MLTIRLQRTGRKGHAQFRVVVQDSRFTPTSGRVVAYVGSYNPHNKQAILDTEKIQAYIANGAQPTPRAIAILKAEKVKLPDWVKSAGAKTGSVRNPEKRRSTAPEQPAEVQEPAPETPAPEEPVVEVADDSTEEIAVAEPTQETPAQESPAEAPAAVEPAQPEADTATDAESETPDKPESTQVG